MFADREPAVLGLLTEEDVQFFEQKWLARDEIDKKDITKRVIEGSIVRFATEDWRKDLLPRICNYVFMIPSLFTFFQDVKILQEVAPCMSHLFPSSRGGTVLNSTRESL